MMNRFNSNSLKDTLSRLLDRCADWFHRLGRFRPFGKAAGDREVTGAAGAVYRWIWDPERQVWLMETDYKYRSLEVRMQAGEAEPPYGIRSLRRILGSRP